MEGERDPETFRSARISNILRFKKSKTSRLGVEVALAAAFQEF